MPYRTFGLLNIVLLAAACCLEFGFHASATEPARLLGHKSAVSETAFSPDGRLLASYSRDGQTIIWDLVAGAGRRVSSRSAQLDPRDRARRNERHLRFTTETEPMLLAGGSTFGKLIDPRNIKVVTEWDLGTTTTSRSPGPIHYVGGRRYIDFRSVVEAGSQSFTPVANGSRKSLQRTGPKLYAVDRGVDHSALSAVSPDGSRWATNLKLPRQDDKRIQVLDAATGDLQCDLKSFTAKINDVVWIASDRLVILSGKEQRVTLWDVSGEGRLLASLETCESLPRSFEFPLLVASADWSRIAIKTETLKTAIISVKGDELRLERNLNCSLDHGYDGAIASFSRDGARLLANTAPGPINNLVQFGVFETSTGNLISSHTWSSQDARPELSPDGSVISIGRADGAIDLIAVGHSNSDSKAVADAPLSLLIDLSLGDSSPKNAELARYRKLEPCRIEFSPTADRLVVGRQATHGEISGAFWGLSFASLSAEAVQRPVGIKSYDGKVLAPVAIQAWTFLPDGSILVEGQPDSKDSAKSRPARVNQLSGELVFDTTSKSEWVTAIQTSPNGRFFAARVTNRNSGVEPRIDLIERATGRLVRTLATEGKGSNYACSFIFSATGRRLAARFREVIHIYDVATGKELPQAGKITARTFWLLDDGQILAYLDDRNRLHGLDLSTQAEVFLWSTIDNQGGDVSVVEISGDGQLAAVASKTGVITLRNPKTGDVLHRFNPFSTPIVALGLSSKGDFLAASDPDRRLMAWKVGPLSDLTPTAALPRERLIKALD